MVPNVYETEVSPPVWMGDFSSRDSILPFPGKINPTGFLAEDGAIVTVAAIAAVDAVAVTVAALPNALPIGTVLDFGGKKFARLTAAAAKNAASLTVAPLATALAINDVATYAGVSKKRVPSGTLVGRTYAERDAGTGFGPADVAADDEIYLTVRDISDLSMQTDMEFYKPNSLVKENFLPGWATMTTQQKANIRALYRCITGEA